MNAAQGTDCFRIGFGSLALGEVPVVIGLMEKAATAASHLAGDRSHKGICECASTGRIDRQKKAPGSGAFSLSLQIQFS